MVGVADSEEKLQSLVDCLMQKCRRMGLRINKGKTEVKEVIERSGRFPVTTSIDATPLKQVDWFRYLGSLVSEEGRCDAEICARTGMTKANIGSMRKVLTNMSLGTHLKIKLLSSYVCSGLLYGCESWNVSSVMQRRLEDTEMYFIRRMLRVPWTARRTNKEVMQVAGISRKLVVAIRQR